MKRWQINYTQGAPNIVVAATDIWTGLPGVSSVDDLGAVPVVTEPVVFEAVDFIRHAAEQLSPSRVVDIEEAFRDHPSADLRYAWKEYDKTKTFTKEKVDEFLSEGVAASILTAQEKAAILDSWPT